MKRIIAAVSVLLCWATIDIVPAKALCPGKMISYWELNEDATSQNFGGYLDKTENANTALCSSNCPTISNQGAVDNSQIFNGNNTGINAPARNMYNFGATDSFSIELWVKRAPGISNREVLIGRNDPLTSMQWRLSVEASGKAAFSLTSTGNESMFIQGDKILDNSKWHHVVFIRDAENLENRLYVDGKIEVSENIIYNSGFSSTAPINIGYIGGGTPGSFFNGSMDEIAIYGRVLTTNEIDMHYYISRGYCTSYDQPVNIMPLGDSITYDDYTGDIRDPSERVAYRLSLWESLDFEGYRFDFVGNQVAGDDFSPPFDPDNEGHPGFTDAQIASFVYGYLTNNPADVILLHIGTNELDTNPDNVEDILDEIDRFSEKITVVLARIIKRVNDDGTTRLFNNAVEGRAELRIADGDKIVMVDMEDGAGIDYRIGVDMIDTLHPNESGYEKMAEVWFTSLQGFLPVFIDPEEGDNNNSSGSTCFIGTIRY